jgi:hypothetical protein
LITIIAIYYFANHDNIDNRINKDVVIVGKDTTSINGRCLHLITKDDADQITRFNIPVNRITYKEYEIGDTIYIHITKSDE